MKILRTVAELKNWRREVGMNSLGFVPTMGALHEGHRSLLSRARAENASVLLSIFVNPAQFNQTSDLEAYPRTEEADLEVARSEGVDAVFLPDSPAELYPDGYRYEVREKEFSSQLCGEFRPGHFEGVLTVVMKLFHLSTPDRAYFGEKDFQQLRLIEGMVEAFFMEVRIVRCATLRESDGLAMSSRNLRLGTEARKVAPGLHRVLTEVADAAEARRQLEAQGFRVEYLEEKQGRRLAAAWLEEVRLIDNVPL